MRLRRPGINLTILISGSSGTARPAILLSAQSIAEDAASGSVVGTLSVSNGSGSYTFSITFDPDSKFAIDGDDLETDATLNYETATSHQVTIEADNSVDDPISRIFTIQVTNVLEVTLNALTLDADEIEEGSPENTVVGAIQGKSSGSTLSLTGDANGRFKLSGTNIVAGSVATDFDAATSHNITVRETHADGSNSPRDSVIEITVLDEFNLDAPVLVKTSGTEDNTPDAIVTIDEAAVGVGLFLESQIDTDIGFGSPASTTVEIDANPLDLGLSSLPDGTRYWRVRIVDTDETTPLSDWSNVETVTINVGGGDAASADFSIATNSQYVPVLLAEF